MNGDDARRVQPASQHARGMGNYLVVIPPPSDGKKRNERTVLTWREEEFARGLVAQKNRASLARAAKREQAGERVPRCPEPCGCELDVTLVAHAVRCRNKGEA